MSTISISPPARVPTSDWTAADIVDRFGPMPLARIRMVPAPGTATERDVVCIRDSEKRLCELVDRALVEKAMGFWESGVAAVLIEMLGAFVRQRDLGVVLSSDGMMRIAEGLVRIPDAAFVSWSRLPGRRFPRRQIPDLVPDLAVEILSPGNTSEEMSRKLDDYLTAGVRLIWYIDPRSRTATVYRGSAEPVVVTAEQSLDGGEVLPGLVVPLNELFRHAPE